MSRHDLQSRYGGRALITGAARGIGRAFATALAIEGFDLLIVDRLGAETRSVANDLAETHGIDVQPIELDLLRSDVEAHARAWVESHDIGLLVSNAGISPMGRFLDIPIETHFETLDLNCRATLALCHVVGRAMVGRGRGAVVIVSSESAFVGAPFFAHYAATKGYALNLSYGLWEELRERNVDVLGVCPGLTNTAPIRQLGLDRHRSIFVPLNEPSRVVEGALRALGRQPVVVPVWMDRFSANLMGRVLPRKWALSLVGRSMKKMKPELDSE